MPHRSPWGAFPDVVILSDVTPVKKHPHYADAKAGDIDQAAPSAKRLAADFVTEGTLAQVRLLISETPLLLPVHALEGAGHNRIPGAFAELLAEELGLEVETSIVQANVVNHTGATGWERLARPPVFAGNVMAGRSYVLVDDFVGQGGTLANLRGHIICRRHGDGRCYVDWQVILRETRTEKRDIKRPIRKTWTRTRRLVV